MCTPIVLVIASWDVVVHCFRLVDVLGAADGLQLFARLKRLAHAISVLPEHRLFVGHDVLPAVVEPDDGVWRFGLEPRRQDGRAQMDPWQRSSSASLSSCSTLSSGTT